MTRGQAATECDRLAHEPPDRDTTAWFPRQHESGEWVVVRVARPALAMKRADLRTGLVDVVRPDPSQDVPQEPRPFWGPV
jgi:hypothetical protein